MPLYCEKTAAVSCLSGPWGHPVLLGWHLAGAEPLLHPSGAPLAPGQLRGSLLWCSSLDGSRPAAGLQESKGRLPGLSRRGRASLGSHHLPPPTAATGQGSHQKAGGWGSGGQSAQAGGRGGCWDRAGRPLPPRAPAWPCPAGHFPPELSQQAAGLSGRRAERSGEGRSGAGTGGLQPHQVHASAKAAHIAFSTRRTLHPQPGDDSTTSQSHKD